jgi:hypothetical protein
MRRNLLFAAALALPIVLAGCSDRPTLTQPVFKRSLTQTQTAAGVGIPSGGAAPTTQNTTSDGSCGSADNTGYLGSGYEVCVPPTP